MGCVGPSNKTWMSCSTLEWQPTGHCIIAGELPITMLACARIGAVHSVVFAGFSAESLASRVEDCKSRVVVTTSGVMRGKKKLETKAIVDDALQISKQAGFEVRHESHMLQYSHSSQYSGY